MTCPILFPSSPYYGLLRALFLHLPVLKIPEHEEATARGCRIDWVNLRFSHLHPLLMGGRKGAKNPDMEIHVLWLALFGDHRKKPHLALKLH